MYEEQYIEKKQSEEDKIYPHLYKNIEDWPIFKLHQNRKDIVKNIIEKTCSALLEKYGAQKLSDIIARTIYLERIRIKEEPWKVDPPNEDLYWKRIRSQLVRKSLDKKMEEANHVNEEILHSIVNRYTEEIVGTFNTNTFNFARKFLRLFFNRLLNTAAGKKLGRIWGSKHRITDRLKAKGEIHKLRALFDKGTVVVVPTHFSNLDSILIGYVMDQILGLPSFSYGAGLNLYNTGYTAFFMNRLGAYRVDRRKKNPIYLETLKTMSRLSIEEGVNSLFFPGGTRSRSGHLENKLKLGLLGTVIEAQRAQLEKSKNSKIYIVPLILGYDVTLEAKFLIEQHLKRTGKEFYLTNQKDNFYSFRSIMKFAWKSFSKSSKITLSFGKPMDVLGNLVDEEGISYDRFGNQVNIDEYFIKDGKIDKNIQREQQYTQLLADRIVERYHKENIVLPSHLMAYAAFSIISQYNKELDLYGILRLPSEELILNRKTVKKLLNQLLTILEEMENLGKIKLSKVLSEPLDSIIDLGIDSLGVYHANKPLLRNSDMDIITQDLKLLYYYHNRLDNYKLIDQIDWSQVIYKQDQEKNTPEYHLSKVSYKQ